MERSRNAPPTSSADAGVVSLPAELPSLNVLVQQALAPGAGRHEVDALLSGLAQPLPSEHSPRERADLLLSLIESGHLADFTGSDGRTVRSAAVEALLALGYPYALEVPPEALERGGTQAGTSNLLDTPKGKWGLGLVILVGALQSIAAVALAAGFNSVDSLLLIALAFIAATTFVPAGLTVTGHNRNSKGLKIVGTVWLVLSALLWIVPGFFLTDAGPFGLISLTLGCMILAGAILMNSDS